MKKLFGLILLLVCFESYATGDSVVKDPPTTVEYVDISKYVGQWYELARMPNSFQDNKRGDFGVCYNTIAEYSVRSNDKLNVTNTCYRFNAQNESQTDIAKAKAEVVEGSGNAKLKVNFTGIFFLEWFGIGNGDYWILGLGPVNNNGLYSWAFVGSPKRNFGWILSRTKSLSEAEQKKIKELIVLKGYTLDSFKNFVK